MTRCLWTAAVSAAAGMLLQLAMPATAQPPEGRGPPAGPPSGFPAGPPAGASGGPDDFIGYLAQHGELPPLPAGLSQPSPDPRNLEGTWMHDQMLVPRIERDMYGVALPLTDKGRQIRDRRIKATYVNQQPYTNASAECVPPGQPWPPPNRSP